MKKVAVNRLMLALLASGVIVGCNSGAVEGVNSQSNLNETKRNIESEKEVLATGHSPYVDATTTFNIRNISRATFKESFDYINEKDDPKFVTVDEDVSWMDDINNMGGRLRFNQLRWVEISGFYFNTIWQPLYHTLFILDLTKYMQSIYYRKIYSDYMATFSGDLSFQYVPDRKYYHCDNIPFQFVYAGGDKDFRLKYLYSNYGGLFAAGQPYDYATDYPDKETILNGFRQDNAYFICYSKESSLMNMFKVNIESDGYFNFSNTENPIMASENIEAKIAYYFSKLSPEEKNSIINNGNDFDGAGDLFLSPNDIKVVPNPSSSTGYSTFQDSNLDSLETVSSTLINNSDITQNLLALGYSNTKTDTTSNATTSGWKEMSQIKLGLKYLTKLGASEMPVEFQQQMEVSASTTDTTTTATQVTLTLPAQNIAVPPHECKVVSTNFGNTVVGGNAQLQMAVEPLVSVTVRAIKSTSVGGYRDFEAQKLNLYKFARLNKTDGLLGSDDYGRVWVNGSAVYKLNHSSQSNVVVDGGEIVRDSNGNQACLVNNSKNEFLAGATVNRTCDNLGCRNVKGFKLKEHLAKD